MKLDLEEMPDIGTELWFMRYDKIKCALIARVNIQILYKHEKTKGYFEQIWAHWMNKQFGGPKEYVTEVDYSYACKVDGDYTWHSITKELYHTQQNRGIAKAPWYFENDKPMFYTKEELLKTL